MRTVVVLALVLLSPIAILLLRDCAGPPTPAEVAGIYEVFSSDGDVVEGEDYPWAISYDFKRDGAFFQRTINKTNGDTTSLGGFFSVHREEGGCVGILVWWGNTPDKKGEGTICEDKLIITGTMEGKPREIVYRKVE